MRFVPGKPIRKRSMRSRLKSIVNSLLRPQVRGSRFVSQVLTVGCGAGLAQVALICFSPVLSRMYAPEAFATFALFAVIAHLLSIAGSGRYEMALMLPEKDVEAGCALIMAGGLPLVVTVIGYLGMIICTLAGASLKLWVWTVPVGALVFAWGTVTLRWQARKQRFSAIAHAEMVAVAISLTFQLTAGMLANQASGMYLVAGQLLGRMAAVGFLWQTMKEDWLSFKDVVSRRKVLKTAKDYIHFPLFSSTASLIGKVNQEVPKLMLAAFFSSHALGSFALCTRALNTPTSLVGRAIGDVFFPWISKSRNNTSKTREMLLYVCGASLLLILGPALVLFFWAEQLFVFVFGEQWALAGAYARLLIPVLIAQFVVQPVALALHAFEKQSAVFIWQIGTLAVLVSAFLFGYSYQRADTAILCYSWSYAVLLLIYLVMIFHFAGSR
ncbi:MAG: oligosaccharide flippase family protein, partial [Pirellulales bacterium]|nr:oligosaccharide flippase family protein [Pirellulales bacterium]